MTYDIRHKNERSLIIYYVRWLAIFIESICDRYLNASWPAENRGETKVGMVDFYQIVTQYVLMMALQFTCVPNLKFNLFSIDRNHTSTKLNANG